jgi:hypothetical protein
LFFPLLYVSVYAPYLDILGSISKGRPEKIISKLIRAYLLSLRPDKMKNFLICYVYLYLILLEKNKEENSSGKKTI